METDDYRPVAQYQRDVPAVGSRAGNRGLGRQTNRVGNCIRLLRRCHDMHPGQARLEGAADAKAEGRKICAELIQQYREIPGLAGVHIMAPAQKPDAIADAIRLAT